MSTYQPLHQNITKVLHAKYLFAYNNIYQRQQGFTTHFMTPEGK